MFTFVGHPLVVGQIETHEILKVQQRGHQTGQLVGQPKVRETHVEERSEQYAHLRKTRANHFSIITTVASGHFVYMRVDCRQI